MSMPFRKPPITALSDKFLGFCAVTPNKKFFKLFERAGVKNILISYHYIRKNPALTQDFLHYCRDNGGLFMTDSGAFSFLNDRSFDPNKFDWNKYVEEYVEWLDQNKEFIFSACNLDVDLFVGADRVRKWNEKFFEKLGEDINCIYVAHKNVMGRGDLDAFNDYCSRYDYVAVNETLKGQVSAIYQKAKTSKTMIHGLAWTKPTLLDDYPFFSVDSSSWVNYQKYGATPVWDGTNFKTYDKDDKHIRKTLKNQCGKYGVKFYEFCNEKDEETGQHNDDEGLTFSLRTWMDVYQNLKKFARTKLSFDLKHALKDKVTIFMEDKSGGTTRPQGGGVISGILQNSNIASTPAVPTMYEIQEDGSEVAIYEKRPEKVSLEEFLDNSGGALICNYCHISDKCPKFKEDNTCAFDFTASNVHQDPMKTMEFLIKKQTERLTRAMFIEQMEGGNINKVFSAEFHNLDKLNKSRVELMTIAMNGGVDTKKIIIDNGGKGEQEHGGGGFRDLLVGLMGK